MFHQNVRGGDEKMSTHALQERQAYDIIKDLRFLAFRATNHVLQSAYVVPTQDFVPATKTTGPGSCFLLPLWVYLFY